jgi:hypothetical protein
MIILAIDPGTEKSAYVTVGVTMAGRILPPIEADKIGNEGLVAMLPSYIRYDFMAIERPQCTRHSGKEVTETILWAGRFVQACATNFVLYDRAKVGWHILKEKGWNDSKIRTAIINLWYPDLEKKDQERAVREGPLAGVKADIWQALALAMTANDLKPWGDYGT